MSKLLRVSLDRFKNMIKEDPLRNDLLIPKSYHCEQVKSEDNQESNTLVFCMSTATIDRENDTINVDGWELDSFNKAGVMLWGHDSSLPNIGASRGSWIEGNRLLGRIEFTPKDIVHPFGTGFGHSVYRMYRDNFLKTVSVGFKTLEWKYNEDRGDSAVDFLKQSLLELSAVPIPANPEAMIEAGRKGIDIQPIYNWLEKELDCGSELIVSRSMLEGAHKALKATPSITGKTISGDKIIIDDKTTFKKVMSKLFGQKDNKESLDMKEIKELSDKLDSLAEQVKSLSEILVEKQSKDIEKKDIEDKAKQEAEEEKEEKEFIHLVKSMFNEFSKEVEKGVDDKLCEYMGRLKD